MEIITHTDRCIGSGLCALTAPDVFTQDDDGIVALLPGRTDDARLEEARAAEHGCPVQAIEVHST